MTSHEAFTLASAELTVLNVPFHERCRLVKETRVGTWSIVHLYRVRS